MAKVKIKFKHKNDPRHRLGLLEIMARNQIYATRILSISDGYLVITRTDEDLDRLLSKDILAQLTKMDYTPITPPELKAKRTIILSRLDEFIYSNSEDTLINEIEDKNTWIDQNEITDIYKFPKSNTIKITFMQSNTAKQATEKGLLMCSMSVPTDQIKVETYIHITTCMKCYQLQDHFTSQCKKPADYQICSECGEQGHSWRNCTNTTKRCINCGDDHRTLAMRCPLRKKIIEEKKKEAQTTSATYSQVTQNNTAYKQNQFSLIDKETNIKIQSCMNHAHYLNAINPGTFNAELQKLYKANGLPTIIIPEDPPSRQILNLNSQIDYTGKTQVLEPTEATPANQNMNPNGKHRQPESSTNEEMPTLEQIDGRSVGLQIITKSSTGWPQNESLSLRRLKEGLEKGTYKWTYSNNSYPEAELYQNIINNEVNFESCWCVIDDYRFNKIRNGPNLEKTPPPSKINKQRHHQSSK